MVAYNKYGGYFTPISSQQRPAVQEVLKGSVYEPETIKFMREHCGDGDIIHAGTFFGDFLPGLSTALSPKAKVWAFEPSHENFRCAQITKQINKLQNVELINCGLGEMKSVVSMLVATEDGTNLGGASMIVEEDSKGKLIDIEISRIDDMVPVDRHVSILQLDVEGFEKEALAGGSELIKRCSPILILEDNNDIIKTEWFEDNILSLGYNVTRTLHENTVLERTTQ